MILHQKTHTPFDEWFDKHQVELEKLFGSLAQMHLRSLLFAAFELGAIVGGEEVDDFQE